MQRIHPTNQQAETQSARLRSVVIWATCLICLGFISQSIAAPLVVKPRHLSTAVGPTEIKITPGIARASVDRVEIYIDGTLFETLTASPWETQWDAGDGDRGHSIEIRVFAKDGSMERAVSRTSALKINQYSDVDLVNLYALVRDSQGNYVGNLDQSDFRVLENGREQRITRFASTRKPLRVGIVLDTSRTMQGKKLEKAKQAALDFLTILTPEDEGLLVTFDSRVRVDQDITSDFNSLASSIKATEAGGGTALYDAIFRASKSLANFDGRRVMILLSDGRDEAMTGIEPGSLHTLDEALVQALRNEVMIFSIGLGRRLGETLDFHRTRSLKQILKKLADDTGGRPLISNSPAELRRAFRQVAADLGHQYTLAYTSSDDERDGRWRSVKVLTPDNRKLEVVTKRGYYAPKAAPDTKP